MRVGNFALDLHRCPATRTTSLSTVDVSNNNISGYGVSQVIGAARRNASVREFSVGGNGVPSGANGALECEYGGVYVDSLLLRYAGESGGNNSDEERGREEPRLGAQGTKLGGNVVASPTHRRTASGGDAMRLRSEQSMEWLEGLRA